MKIKLLARAVVLLVFLPEIVYAADPVSPSDAAKFTAAAQTDFQNSSQVDQFAASDAASDLLPDSIDGPPPELLVQSVREPPPIQPPPPLEPPNPSEPPASTTSTCAPRLDPNLTGSQATTQIREIQITGNTVLQAEIERVSQDCLQQFQQPIPPEQFLSQAQIIADAITQLYLNAGYLTSRALVEGNELIDGVLRIQVIEGSLPPDNIQISWADQQSRPRLEAYVRDRILLGAGTPLRLSRLEDQLRLLKIDPLFTSDRGGNVEASLRLSGETGQSVLAVTLTRARAFRASASIDNYSPPGVGSEAFTLGVNYINLIGTGDSISLSYNHSFTNGLNVLGLNYQVPVNPMNGTIQLSAGFDFTRVTDPEFDQLNIEGESQYYELGYRQPIIRTPREELALGLSFAYRNGQTFQFNREPTPFVEGADEDGVSRTSVLRFSQEYIRRDVRGAWVGRSQFNFGLDLLDATINDAPTPSGQFFSWLGQVQRSQRLSRRNLLLIQADLQLAANSLLPSEQFFLGGIQSVRGYRQNVRSGDNGFRFSIEDQITVLTNKRGEPQLQLAPFVELGAVWNHPGNPNEIPAQNFLAGAGLGILWQPLPGLSLRADYGFPFVDLEGRGSNLQDQGLYFSVNYTF